MSVSPSIHQDIYVKNWKDEQKRLISYKQNLPTVHVMLIKLINIRYTSIFYSPLSCAFVSSHQPEKHDS